MSRNRRWDRHLLYGFLGCVLITVAVQGIPQEPAPETAERHGGEEGGHRQHGRDGEGQGLHHDFSDAEHWTTLFDSEERAGWQKPEHVVDLMGIEPGMTVADLGAGTGFFLAYLVAAAGADGRVLALDPEPNMVTFMQRRADHQGWTHVEVRRIPFDDPDLEDGSVDRVLVVNTWHHIDSRSSYAAKLLRALKPGGSVWVVDYTLDSPSGPPPPHRLPAEQIIHELEAGGLEARQIEEDLPRQFIVVGSRDADGG